MKKLLCLTLTAVLAAALAAPAFADTTVNQDSTEKKAETTVKFEIDPTYIVTIPGTVELAKKTAEDGTITYEKDLTVTAKDVRLNEKKELKVSLQSDYKLTVKNTALTYELPYTVTVKTPGSSSDKKVTENDSKVTSFETDTKDQSVTLHFAADNPTYAGDYKDTVTFTLAVVDTTKNENGGK